MIRVMDVTEEYYCFDDDEDYADMDRQYIIINTVNDKCVSDSIGSHLWTAYDMLVDLGISEEFRQRVLRMVPSAEVALAREQLAEMGL